MSYPMISLKLSAKLGPAAAFGVEELKKALVARGHRIGNRQPDVVISIAQQATAGGEPEHMPCPPIPLRHRHHRPG